MSGVVRKEVDRTLQYSISLCFVSLMKDYVHILKKISAGFLLVLFVGYIGCITLFCHEHFVNGQRIIHSHPYSDSSGTEKHTHTSFEFTVIAALSMLLMLAVSFGYLFRVFAIQLLKKGDLVNDFTLTRSFSILSLRGPPAC